MFWFIGLQRAHALELDDYLCPVRNACLAPIPQGLPCVAKAFACPVNGFVVPDDVVCRHSVAHVTPDFRVCKVLLQGKKYICQKY